MTALRFSKIRTNKVTNIILVGAFAFPSFACGRAPLEDPLHARIINVPGPERVIRVPIPPEQCHLSPRGAIVVKNQKNEIEHVLLLKEGEEKTFIMSDGATHRITLLTVNKGYTYAEKSLEIEINGESHTLTGEGSQTGGLWLIGESTLSESEHVRVHTIISVLTKAGGVVYQDVIPPNRSLFFEDNEGILTAIAGYMFGIKGANLTIGNTTTFIPVGGVFPLPGSELFLRIDDLSNPMTLETRTPHGVNPICNIFPRAILEIGTMNGTRTETRSKYDSPLQLRVNGVAFEIAVEEIGAGYTYGAKWARIRITGEDLFQRFVLQHPGVGIRGEFISIVLKDLQVD